MDFAIQIDDGSELLPEYAVEKILESGLDILVISVDGGNAEDYEKINETDELQIDNLLTAIEKSDEITITNKTSGFELNPIYARTTEQTFFQYAHCHPEKDATPQTQHVVQQAAQVYHAHLYGYTSPTNLFRFAIYRE